jgi:glycine C-acetyltransferase
VVGKTGHGVTELFNLKGKIEIITGTLGKAFGGAIGGFTTGKKEIRTLKATIVHTCSQLNPPLVANGNRNDQNDDRNQRFQTSAQIRSTSSGK